MIIPIATQFNLLLYSFLAGILTGIMFDMYRLIRGFENPGKIVTALEDILFWILAALIVFIFLLYFDYAYVGIYVYGWITLGTLLYIKFISKYFIVIQQKIFKNTFKTMRIGKNFMIYPFKLIIYGIKSKK